MAKAKSTEKSRPAGAYLPSIKSGRLAPNDPMRIVKGFAERQIEDPFGNTVNAVGSDFSIQNPPYNPNALLRLPHENNTLAQCVQAMVTNCEGHGYRLEYVGPEGQQESPEAKAEKDMLEAFLAYPNDDTSMQELRERARRDKESVGYCYYELGRDQSGVPVMLAHIPANTMRMTGRDRAATQVEVTLPRPSAPGGVQKIKVKKKFRRFVQQIGTKQVYFKEYGDPRKIDPTTGKENKALSWEESATEVIYDSIYAPGNVYGLPRWINQLPSILGSREAELCNLDFFKENAIPAMALLVSGGMVTQTTLDQIEAHFLAAKGRQSMNRLLIVEAQGDEDAASPEGNIPPPKLELKPLAMERQQDQLFQKYDENCGNKVRSSFRLPPIFIGLSQDYTYATAKTSFEVAESQVFAPERKKADDLLNLKVFGPMGARFWKFASLPPKLSDPAEIINALTVFNSMGAMTPNIAIALANEYFDLEIPMVEEDWGDYPFAIVQTLAVSGRLADGNMQEIMKEIDPLTGGPFEDDEEDEEKDTDSEEEKERKKQRRVLKRVKKSMLMLRRSLATDPSHALKRKKG